MKALQHRYPGTRVALKGLLALLALGTGTFALALGSALVNPMPRSHAPAPEAASHASAPASAAAGEETPIVTLRSDIRKQLKDALEQNKEASGAKGKKPSTSSTVVVNNSGKPDAADAHAPAAGHAPSSGHGTAPVRSSHLTPAPSAGRAGAARHGAKAPSAHAAAAHEPGGAAHWSYEGENGPQAWGALQPSFNVCAIGKRQSPIHIEESTTLRGPAEPLQISYQPSKGSVVNNGHTIQVDLQGENTITVRGSTYKLVQFHFHHPAEEKLNYKGFAMVAHLVHRNAEGQLAVLAVLFDPGEASPLIQKVWTHMPLDVDDRVMLPEDLIDLNETLPKDRRYYQFIGSLTTPPCTEGVLWLVLKQPMTLSREQLALFSQLFPNNARPTQPSFGRVVREAQ